MRQLLALVTALVIACGLSVAGLAQPSVQPDAVFLLTGGGWGHGVGMSQWGAYGQAKAGRSYRDILTTYYTGVDVGPAPAGTVPKQVRVLVDDGKETVAVGSSSPFRVRDAGGTTYELPAGAFAVSPKLELPVGENGAKAVLTGPLLFLPAKGATLSYGGRQYRANLRVAAVQKRLQVVNVVPLETYLLGVVPGEMPKDWPLEALKAQAVAARSYAIANLVAGRSFDLYSDWRSQMYHGAESEAPGPTRAVKETAGEVVLYEGKVASVQYFSSSGGRTSSALDVYGQDVPYLVSVDDPWDSVSPLHAWAPRLFTGKSLAKALGSSSAIVDASIVPGSTGHPAALSLTTATGKTLEVRLTEVRAKLGLRSSTFRLGTLRLARPAAPVASGDPVLLTGVARDVDRPALQKLGPLGTWVAARKLVLADDGTFSVTLRPAATLKVRLVADGVVGTPITVRVSGSVA